jgi:hypothetical protein
MCRSEKITVGKSIGFREESDIEITIGIAGALDRNDQPGGLRLSRKQKRKYKTDRKNSSDHWLDLFLVFAADAPCIAEAD